MLILFDKWMFAFPVFGGHSELWSFTPCRALMKISAKYPSFLHLSCFLCSSVWEREKPFVGADGTGSTRWPSERHRGKIQIHTTERFQTDQNPSFSCYDCFVYCGQHILIMSFLDFFVCLYWVSSSILHKVILVRDGSCSVVYEDSSLLGQVSVLHAPQCFRMFIKVLICQINTCRPFTPGFHLIFSASTPKPDSCEL